MHKSNKEGYRKPKDYDSELRQRLLDITAVTACDESYTVPPTYGDQLRADILAETVQSKRKIRPMVMRWAAVAAIALPLLMITAIWQTEVTDSTADHGIADVSDVELYEYLATNADLVAVDDLLDYELIDTDILEDLTEDNDEEIESYLESEADDLDLDVLDDYL